MGFSSLTSLPNQARVVVVGSGRMGQIRSSIIYANPRFELSGIVDVSIEAATKLAEKYRTRPFENLSDALNDLQVDKAIDGIVVCSPTFTHEEVIHIAAKHGISVFTEKPVDETSSQIEDLFCVAQKAGITLCCGFQRRFDSSYVSAASAVKTGKIGRPVYANIFFGDHPCPPKEFLLSGGNIFMDLSAHDVDYIMDVLDDVVVSVYATGTSSTPELEAAGVHDNATMMMTFSKGTVATLFMSRSATYGYDQRCEIFGDKGMISVGNESAHTSVLSNCEGIHHSRLKHSFPQRFQQGFEAELDAFADTILMKKPWPVTAENCARVQKVADAARHSCELKEAVTISYGVE